LKFTVTKVVQDSGGGRVVHFTAENGETATFSTTHSLVDSFHLEEGKEVDFSVDMPKPPRVSKAKKKVKKAKAKKGKK
jgi:hypothetical protein